MREHFRWIKGQEKLASYESSPGKLRHFCSVCGSHLVAERPAQPHVIVRVAHLVGDEVMHNAKIQGLHSAKKLPSPSIEKTSFGKPVAASHIKR